MAYILKRCKVCGEQKEMHELNEHCSVKCHKITMDFAKHEKLNRETLEQLKLQREAEFEAQREERDDQIRFDKK